MSLKQIRINNRISQGDLSAYSGVSVRTIQEYEQDRRLLKNAKAEVVYKLSIALGCSIEELLEEDAVDEIYPFSINDDLTVFEISRLQINSDQYHAIGRFIFRNNSCLIAMVYKDKILEVGFPIIFKREIIPWIMDAARMKMESTIEEFEFQSIDNWISGDDYEVWD